MPSAAPRHGQAVAARENRAHPRRITGGTGGTEIILGLRRDRTSDAGIPVVGPFRRMRGRLRRQLWQGSGMGGHLAFVVDRLSQGLDLARRLNTRGSAERASC